MTLIKQQATVVRPDRKENTMRLTHHDHKAIEQAKECGLTFTPYGRAWLLHGEGVDVLMDRPSRLTAWDLLPVIPDPTRRHGVRW